LRTKIRFKSKNDNIYVYVYIFFGYRETHNQLKSLTQIMHENKDETIDYVKMDIENKKEKEKENEKKNKRGRMHDNKDYEYVEMGILFEKKVISYFEICIFLYSGTFSQKNSNMFTCI